MTSPTDSDQPQISRQEFLDRLSKRQETETEYETVRLQHERYKTAMSEELIWVPLPDTKNTRILDAGTDGIWMVDVAKQYPNAKLMGTYEDKNPFEHIKDLPESIEVKVQNVLEDWPVEHHNACDLVHQRYPPYGLLGKDGGAIVKQLFDNVKPGGYLQFVEPGDFESSESNKTGDKLVDSLMDAGPEAKNWMEDAGAVEVAVEKLSFNTGFKAATLDEQISTTLIFTKAFSSINIPSLDSE